MKPTYTDIVSELSTPEQGGKYVQKRDDRIKVLRVFAARRKYKNISLEALLLVVNPNDLPLYEEISSDGFSINQLAAEGADFSNETRLCINLLNEEYREVFHILAEDICQVLICQSSTKVGILAVFERIQKWQKLLHQNGPKGLSDEKQVGLFGELKVLHDLFLNHLSAREAIEGWVGPKRADQDFQFDDLSVEVKTSRSSLPDFIRVSNERQLESRNHEDLILVLLSVCDDQITGVTLPQLVEQIEASLNERVCSTFKDRLFNYGYLHAQKHLYQDQSYAFNHCSYYKVDDGFPRIISDGLPIGVNNVKYKVNVDACHSHLVSEPVVISKIESL